MTRGSGLIAAFGGVLLLVLFGFVPIDQAPSRSDVVKVWYLTKIDRLADQAATFHASLDALFEERGESSVDQGELAELRAEFVELKLLYKEIEPLVGRLDRHAAQMLNGPPLQRIDEEDMQRTVIEPEGFQSVEEHLFAENPAESRTRLRWLAHRLDYRARGLAASALSRPIEDRHLFEAFRSGLLRVAWLGLTGFDSPVLSNSIAEAEATFAGLTELWSFYEQEVVERGGRGLAEGISRSLEEGRARLAESSFDTFDRLAFLKEVVAPLYSDLLSAHYTLGYPTYREVSPFTRPLRYEVADLFDEDLFDPFFFSPDPIDRLNEEKAELGEALFYDTRLSRTFERSCASCHDPEKAFADGLVGSMKIDGSGVLARNSPTLLNSVFQTKLFWDGRAENFEQQIEDVLMNHAEMQMTFEDLIPRLREEEKIRKGFERAFEGTGDTAITKFGITRALAAYLRTLVSYDGEFDRYLRDEVAEIDPAVRRGYNLFMGKAACGTCHFAPFFNGLVPPDYLETETEVLGVTTSSDFTNPVLDNDPGRYARNLDELYRHSFKTPTLRHIAETAPYMHNGSLKTLEEVVEFYDLGGGVGLGLDVPNQTLPSDRLNLSDQEKRDLVRFMESL